MLTKPPTAAAHAPYSMPVIARGSPNQTSFVVGALVAVFLLSRASELLVNRGRFHLVTRLTVAKH